MNDNPAPRPKSTTFLVRIQFQENTTWQGRIEWLEGKKSKPFRSLLELIVLMQEAQQLAGSGEIELRFHSWDEKEDVS